MNSLRSLRASGFSFSSLEAVAWTHCYASAAFVWEVEHTVGHHRFVQAASSSKYYNGKGLPSPVWIPGARNVVEESR